MEERGLYLQNQLLHEEIRKRVDQISAINTVATTVGHSLDLQVTLDTALKAVTAVVGAEAAGISLIDYETGDVVLRAQLGWINDFVVNNPMRIPAGEGMSGQVIQNDDLIVHNNLTGEEDYAVPSFSKEAFRSIAMAPMHARGRIIGILSIMSHKPDRFDKDIIEVLKAIADTVAVSIENARLHEQHVEQENRLNAILHSTADGIIATDQNSRISLVNQAAATMLDVQPAELLGVPLREADIQVRVRDKLLLALSAEESNSTESFQVSLEEGQELALYVSPVHINSQVEGESNMDGWVIVLQDITHIREAEKARVHFMQAAAHDMKNPLSVTQKSIQMLNSMLEASDETMREVLDIAGSGVDRVKRLIDDLLNIEKIQSGYDFRLAGVDIREMCYEISALCRPTMEASDVDFHVQIGDEVPQMMQLDREWLHRAMHNLLENAAKYAPEGEVIFNVYVQEDLLHFEVVDNGPGIPIWAQSRIFDRFYRVADRKDVRGSGLGLAIVRSVAEAHNGSAYVRSREGEGSTFGLALPIDQDSGA
jgi:PAS domain S-box-containing protein